MTKKILLSIFSFFYLQTYLFSQTQSPRIGAFYFDGWTAFQWDNYVNKKYQKGAYNDVLLSDFPEREPAYGWVTSTLPGIEEQIKDAKYAGINFFIFDWYYCSNGGYEDCFLNNAIKIFQQTTPKDFYFSVMITNDTFDIGPEQWEETETKLLEFFSHPAYYKVDGRPLVLIFQGNKMVWNFGNVKKFNRALESLHNKSVSQGSGNPIIGIMNINRSKFNRLKNVDFATFYNDPYAALRNNRNINPYQKEFTNEQLRRGSELYWQEMLWFARKKFFVPTITAGWDTRPWAGKNEFGEWNSKIWYEKRTEYDIKESTLNALHFNTSHNERNFHNLIFINSWNEYGEGSHISKMANGEFLGIGISEALKESNNVDVNSD